MVVIMMKKHGHLMLLSKIIGYEEAFDEFSFNRNVFQYLKEHLKKKLKIRKTKNVKIQLTMKKMRSMNLMMKKKTMAQLETKNLMMMMILKVR